MLCGPPISEATLCIVNVSQLVEAVSDFVGHGSARGAIVRSGVTFAVEIRRLQYRSREELRVGAEHDDRTRNLRVDRPLDRVNRLFQSGQVPPTMKSLRSAHIAEGIATGDVQR